MPTTAVPAAPPAAPPAARRRPAPDQATVFRRLRSQLVRNGFRVAMETGKVRLVTMVLTSAVVAGFVFGLSWYGCRELYTFQIPIKGLIVGGLFDTLFFTLGGMLTFSTGIILYASSVHRPGGAVPALHTRRGRTGFSPPSSRPPSHSARGRS